MEKEQSVAKTVHSHSLGSIVFGGTISIIFQAFAPVYCLSLLVYVSFCFKACVYLQNRCMYMYLSCRLAWVGPLSAMKHAETYYTYVRTFRKTNERYTALFLVLRSRFWISIIDWEFHGDDRTIFFLFNIRHDKSKACYQTNEPTNNSLAIESGGCKRQVYRILVSLLVHHFAFLFHVLMNKWHAINITSGNKQEKWTKYGYNPPIEECCYGEIYRKCSVLNTFFITSVHGVMRGVWVSCNSLFKEFSNSFH